jgi:aminoglycoside phosphotransferase (APT) family kinase protein
VESQSLTKPKLTEAEVARLARHAFPGTRVEGVEELTEGSFNAAYALRCDGEDLVLKVAPSSDLQLLTYETDLMHGEALFFEQAGAAGVPVPVVRFADLTGSIHPNEFVFLTRLPGTPLHNLKLDPAVDRAVRHELSGHLRRLHTVRGPAFGYPRRDGHTRSPSWRTSFLTILDDLIQDAARLEPRLLHPLPVQAQKIFQGVRSEAAVLDAVAAPVLVHFDIWDGNVFVDAGRSTGRITGIIDGERCFYGDPIAELASLTLYSDIESRPELLDGYGRGELTPDERLRLRMYTVYLYLIMLVEGPTRGFGGEEYLRILAYSADRIGSELEAIRQT